MCCFLALPLALLLLTLMLLVRGCLLETGLAPRTAIVLLQDMERLVEPRRDMPMWQWEQKLPLITKQALKMFIQVTYLDHLTLMLQPWFIMLCLWDIRRGQGCATIAQLLVIWLGTTHTKLVLLQLVRKRDLALVAILLVLDIRPHIRIQMIMRQALVIRRDMGAVVEALFGQVTPLVNQPQQPKDLQVLVSQLGKALQPMMQFILATLLERAILATIIFLLVMVRPLLIEL